MRRPWIMLLSLVLLAGLSGCTAMQAQNPDGDTSPVNAVQDGEDRHLMLSGHDVVAYFTEGRHRIGTPQIESVHQGVTYRFATAEHKALFDKAPAKYIPQYGGYCASGISYAIPWGGDANVWRIRDGKLYIFGGEASRRAFEMDRALNVERADRYWRDEVKGRNSFLQRAKRLVFRVPHYKSGEELEAEYLQRQAAGTLKP